MKKTTKEDAIFLLKWFTLILFLFTVMPILAVLLDKYFNFIISVMN